MYSLPNGSIGPGTRAKLIEMSIHLVGMGILHLTQDRELSTGELDRVLLFLEGLEDALRATTLRHPRPR